jgi:hypothetical protein
VPPCQIVLGKFQTLQDGKDVRPRIGRGSGSHDFGSCSRRMTMANQREASTVGSANARQTEPIQVVMAGPEFDAETLAEIFGLPPKNSNRVARLGARRSLTAVPHHITFGRSS